MRQKLVCHQNIFQPLLRRSMLGIMGLLLFCIEPSAQEPVEGEPAICKIKANGKDYQSQSNTEGYFKEVSGIQPLALVPIEVTYPNGKAGEKVVLTAPNDGSFDNKKQVKVVQLNDQKKCTFTFQLTSHPGLFEVVLRKGTDAKVVQLWVGKE